MGSKVRSQPLQSKEIKISSTVLIHKIYQRAIKPPKDFYQIFKPSTFVQWARCPPGTQPGQQTQGFNLYIFLQQREFNVFWVEIGKQSSDWSFKQKNQKLSLKITGKMLRSSQIHRQLAKLGLQMNSSQQRFLNKRKKASVKNPNTEADPVPFALFWSEFLQSPTGDA